MELFDFTCSHCGAPLPYSDEIVGCRYCGSHFILEGFQKYTVEEKPYIEDTHKTYCESSYFYSYKYQNEDHGAYPSLWSDVLDFNTQDYNTVEMVNTNIETKQSKFNKLIPLARIIDINM